MGDSYSSEDYGGRTDGFYDAGARTCPRPWCGKRKGGGGEADEPLCNCAGVLAALGLTWTLTDTGQGDFTHQQDRSGVMA